MIVIEGKRVSPLESDGVMLFFVYSTAAAEPPPYRNHLHNPLLRVTIYVVKNASRPKPVIFSPDQDGKRFAF